jgi:uncharacterized protein (DUF58 family)
MFAKILPLRFWMQPFWQQWVRVAKPTGDFATLTPRKIYIIPTRWGLFYGVMLFALLAGSINYAVSLGFFVTFLLTSLGNIAMLHTWRNLVHLDVRLLHAKPVFVGEHATVLMQIRESKNRARFALAAQFVDDLLVTGDLAANKTQSFSLPIATHKRGYMACPRIRLHTEFPLSLFHAWAYVESAFQFVVYPQPIDFARKPNLDADNNLEGANTFNKGDDEFNGHKAYQIGDAFSRVDWKASSRGIGIFTKQYIGSGQSTLWLDWDATLGLDTEDRISQLSYWIVEAFEAQQTYGLRLPNLTLNPNNTEGHFHEALTALALM